MLCFIMCLILLGLELLLRQNKLSEYAAFANLNIMSYIIKVVFSFQHNSEQHRRLFYVLDKFTSRSGHIRYDAQPFKY